MTVDDMIALRKALGFNQAQMGDAVGLSLRAIQDIEGRKTPLRALHVAAAERAALTQAVQCGNPMLAPASIRREALDLARLITG